MFNVTVTQADYNAGCPDDPLACPLVIAIIRLMPSAFVTVTREQVVINKHSYRVKPDMLVFIDMVDSGQKVALPQTFLVG